MGYLLKCFCFYSTTGRNASASAILYGMVRYNYREGVTLEKKKSRWFLILVGILVAIAAAYVAAIYLAPQLVTIPFTSLTIDATDSKIKRSQAGQFGDHLFIPQINIDVAIHSDG